MITDLTHRHH